MDNPDLIKTQLAMMWGAYINSNTVTSDVKEALKAYKPEQFCDLFAKWTDEYMALPSELITKDINRFFTMKVWGIG